MLRSSLAAGLCMLMTMPVVGWTQDRSAPLGQRTPVFNALQDSQWVRFTGTGVDRHQGILLAHDGPELVVSGEPGPLRIKATSIDTLWSRGNSAKQGAIVGGIVGAVAGIAAALHYGSTTTEHDFSTGQAALLLGGFGAAGGGIVGTLFGLTLPRWTR